MTPRGRSRSWPAGMTRRMRIFRSGVIALGAFAFAPVAAYAEPGPGTVEVRNEAGAVVTQMTGADALAAAVANVTASRADDTKPWSIVAGAGTYGDVLVGEPNVTVRAADAAAVVVTGTGGTNQTSGGCIDITRGGVVVQAIACTAATAQGIEVRPPAAEGGIVLRAVTVTGSASHGILMSSGAGIVIENATVSGAKTNADGIHLQGIAGAGPYRVQGGVARSNGGDGIDVDGGQRVQISGATVESNGENGLEIDGPGNFDVAADGVTARNNAGAGAALSGGGNRISLASSVFTGNRAAGVAVEQLASPTLTGLRFDGTNGGGDLRFSANQRTGGTYSNLTFLDTPVNLPNDPRGVIVSTATAGQRRTLSRLPNRTVALGRFVRVKDTGAGTSIVRIHFLLGPAELARAQQSGIRVYEDDPPGNRRQWRVVSGSRFDPVGFAEALLSDGAIASGSDARFAIYAPLAPRNETPQVLGVFPANGATYIGRNVVMSALVRDDGPLGTGSFALEIDGRRRGGIELRNGNPVWPLIRVPLGTHTARVRIVDAGGLSTERAWQFTVVNFTPQVKALLSKPRPRSVLRTRGAARLSILMRDDERIAPTRLRVRVDGRRVQVRIRGKRVLARVFLRPGRHRIQVIYTDLDGAQVRRGWTFRTVRSR